LGLTLLLSVLTALALIVHELGHLAVARRCNVPASEISLGLGPKLCGFRLGRVAFNLRILPLGSFVRLDGAALAERSVPQQLLVHLGGISFNLIVALAAHGTIFGWINFLIAVANLLPLYKHDGWKCVVVLMRALLQKKSQPVEWIFTFSGGFISLVILNSVLQLLRLK
jgi:membrane-associated protease RseP (regulator of RpoE activity)